MSDSSQTRYSSFEGLLDHLDKTFIRPSEHLKGNPSLENILTSFAGPVWANAFLINLPIDQTTSIGVLVPENFSSYVPNDAANFAGDLIPLWNLEAPQYVA